MSLARSSITLALLMAPAASLAAEPAGEPTPPEALPTTPVPPPAGAATLVIDRELRLFDLTTDVPELLARDAPMARVPRRFGQPDRLIWRGAQATERGDAWATLDGHTLGPALAGRAVNPLDLHLVPVMALSGYRLHPGVGHSTYAGSIALASRSDADLDAGLWLGEHLQRRLGLAAGTSHGRGESFVAIESRRGREPRSRAEDNLLTAFAKTDVHLDSTLGVELSVRAYDDAWDGAPTLEGDRVLAAAQSDGGSQRGTAFGAAVQWDPSAAISLATRLSYLDDKWRNFDTEAGAQAESVDRNRTTRGEVLARLAPPCLADTVFTLGMRGVWDHGRTRRFGTEARQRVSSRVDRQFDFVGMSADAGAESELVSGLSVLVQGSVWQPTLRLEDARAAAEPVLRDALLGSTIVGLVAETELGKVELRAGTGHRLHPSTLDGAELALSHEGVELTFSGTLALEETLSLAWRAAGFFDHYGESALGDNLDADTYDVSGGEAGIDLVHGTTGVVLAGRVGMLRASGYERGEEPFVTVPTAGDGTLVGLPESAWHVGLLRPRARGLVFELWLDGQGTQRFADAAGEVIEVEPTVDVTARVGYRTEVFALWVGGLNLLDEDEAFAPGEGREERTGYVLFELD